MKSGEQSNHQPTRKPESQPIRKLESQLTSKQNNQPKQTPSESKAPTLDDLKSKFGKKR